MYSKIYKKKKEGSPLNFTSSYNIETTSLTQQKYEVEKKPAYIINSLSKIIDIKVSLAQAGLTATAFVSFMLFIFITGAKIYNDISVLRFLAHLC
jgi:hypothetical protein